MSRQEFSGMKTLSLTLSRAELRSISLQAWGLVPALSLRNVFA